MTYVVKTSGEKEPFSQEKLLTSIARAGIPQPMQKEVLAHVLSKLHEDIPTSEIYQHIMEFLGKSSNPFHKASFALKQSIMQLGPTGYPFEKFLARLFERMGYKTETNMILKGACISHEIDVIMEKNNVRAMVEAKFHNGGGIKTDVHVALYTKARFDDIKGRNSFSEVFLVTNTNATIDALAYAQCVRMQVITWSYPKTGSLRDLVEKFHLHPITTLNSISTPHKQKLLEQNIVLCSELLENEEYLRTLNISQPQIKQTIEEARFVCTHTSS